MYNLYESNPSETVSVLIVPAPAGVAYTVDETSVSLSWDQVDIATSYKIQRATDSLFTQGVEEFTSAENSFTDNGLEVEIEYFYRVTAVCCDGDYISSYSDIVSVMLMVMDVANTINIPDSYSLHQNYPNPFNPSTQIRFDTPKISNVNLTIYNMLGQKVKTYTMQTTPAGYHSLTWNATNDLGVPVSAGVYLYQLQTDGFIKTKKMVLLK